MDPQPPLGLALCGGGVRCAAHIGVLKVLQRERLECQVLAGSSCGALFAALYALGFDMAAVERSLAGLSGRDVFGFTLGRHGVGDSRRFRRYLDSLVGGQRIEDLPRQLVITAADVVTGLAVPLEEGDLAEAIYASCAMPGLFAPARVAGRLLVDGSVLEPLPVGLVRQRGAGCCAGVYFPTAVQHPPGHALAVALRCCWMMMHRLAALSMAAADVVITPDVAGCSLLDFRRLGGCVAAGERAAEAALPALRQALATRKAACDRTAGPSEESILLKGVVLE